MKIESGGEEKIKDVTAIVLNIKIGFGFGPERARREVGTTALLDRQENVSPHQKGNDAEPGRRQEARQDTRERELRQLEAERADRQ